jgi:hypothetical protein
MTNESNPFPSLPSEFPSKTSGNPRISSISFTSKQIYICAHAHAHWTSFKTVGCEGNQGNTRLSEGCGPVCCSEVKEINVHPRGVIIPMAAKAKTVLKPKFLRAQVSVVGVYQSTQFDRKKAMNKVTQTFNHFFPVLKARIDPLRLEMEFGANDKWRSQLQTLIDDGGFLKFEFAFGLAGEIHTSLCAVSKKGKIVRLNIDTY